MQKQIKWIGTYVGEIGKEGELPEKVLVSALALDQFLTGIYKNTKTGEFYVDESYFLKKEAGLTIDEIGKTSAIIRNIVDVTMHYGTDPFWLAEEYTRSYELLSIERAHTDSLYFGYISTPSAALNTYGHGYLYNLGIAIVKNGYMGGFCQYEPSGKPIQYEDLVPLTDLIPSLKNRTITMEYAQTLLQKPSLYKKYKEGKMEKDIKKMAL